jgi:hypothetical protein
MVSLPEDLARKASPPVSAALLSEYRGSSSATALRANTIASARQTNMVNFFIFFPPIVDTEVNTWSGERLLCGKNGIQASILHTTGDKKVPSTVRRRQIYATERDLLQKMQTQGDE